MSFWIESGTGFLLKHKIFKPAPGKKRETESDIQEGLWRDKGCRIGCVKSLGEQIRADHEEMSRLWKKRVNRSLDKSDEEEIGRLLSWLRQEIGLYRELGNRGIEGISLGEIEEIEKDVQDKEKAMMSSEARGKGKQRSLDLKGE